MFFGSKTDSSCAELSHLGAFADASIEKSTGSPDFADDVKDGAALNGNTYDPHIYNDAVAPPEFSAAEERKLLARIDFRLMPVLSILYLLAFLGSFINPSHFILFHDLGLTWVYMSKIARVSPWSLLS